MDTLENGLTIAEVVQCLECKKIMLADERDFLAVHGNITISMSGGVVGNNIDDDGRVYRVSVWCKTCIDKFITRILSSLLLDAGTFEANGIIDHTIKELEKLKEE